MTELRRHNVPTLVTEPATIEDWYGNRSEVATAIFRAYGQAVIKGDSRGCIEIAGMWSNFVQVIINDMPDLYAARSNYD